MEMEIVTRGTIAKTLDESVVRIGHILATRSHIQPVCKIGIIRCYDPNAIDLVRVEIKKMRKPKTA